MAVSMQSHFSAKGMRLSQRCKQSTTRDNVLADGSSSPQSETDSPADAGLKDALAEPEQQLNGWQSGGTPSAPASPPPVRTSCVQLRNNLATLPPSGDPATWQHRHLATPPESGNSATSLQPRHPATPPPSGDPATWQHRHLATPPPSGNPAAIWQPRHQLATPPASGIATTSLQPRHLAALPSSGNPTTTGQPRYHVAIQPQLGGSFSRRVPDDLTGRLNSVLSFPPNAPPASASTLCLPSDEDSLAMLQDLLDFDFFIPGADNPVEGLGEESFINVLDDDLVFDPEVLGTNSQPPIIGSFGCSHGPNPDFPPETLGAPSAQQEQPGTTNDLDYVQMPLGTADEHPPAAARRLGVSGDMPRCGGNIGTEFVALRGHIGSESDVAAGDCLPVRPATDEHPLAAARRFGVSGNMPGCGETIGAECDALEHCLGLESAVAAAGEVLPSFPGKAHDSDTSMVDSWLNFHEICNETSQSPCTEPGRWHHTGSANVYYDMPVARTEGASAMGGGGEGRPPSTPVLPIEGHVAVVVGSWAFGEARAASAPAPAPVVEGNAHSGTGQVPEAGGEFHWEGLQFDDREEGQVIMPAQPMPLGQVIVPAQPISLEDTGEEARRILQHIEEKRMVGMLVPGAAKHKIKLPGYRQNGSKAQRYGDQDGLSLYYRCSRGKGGQAGCNRRADQAGCKRSFVIFIPNTGNRQPTVRATRRRSHEAIHAKSCRGSMFIKDH